MGNQVSGWAGVNGVNLDNDTINGTVNGNEIVFTRNNPRFTMPQEFRGFIMLHDNPQIEARRRMTGADAMAGIFSYLGEWKYGWYATRSGPYREDPESGSGAGGGGQLPSLGGAWTDANQPASITQLVFTSRLGTRSNGTFTDASTVVATDWEGGLRGSVQDNGNTIRWANGTVWFRSGGGGRAGGSQSFPSLGGAWSYANQPTSITQDSNNKLVFPNETGLRSNGTFADASTVIATDWQGGLRGSIQDNGTVWYRKVR